MKSKLVQEFKEFAFKGNALDLAIGVIIGGAFGKIVSSLVNDIIMPPFGFLLKGIDFKNFAWVLERNMDGTPVATISYGNFLQNLIEFLIVGFSIFLIVRAIQRVGKRFRQEEKVKELAAPELSDEVKLLREIRDLLKK